MLSLYSEANSLSMASAGASGNSTLTPSCNRLLQRKWDEKRLQAHKDRLRSIKPSVDNLPPRNFVHIKQNLRKQREEDDRLALIDKHNHELLSRMHHIMHTTGRVDHRNLDWRPKKSLNYIKRQREAERVARENQAILRRLQTVRPQYSTKGWDGDFRVHQTRSKCLSLFPPIVSPPKVSPKAQVLPKKRIELPAIEQGRPETQPSEVQEEIDVED